MPVSPGPSGLVKTFNDEQAQKPNLIPQGAGLDLPRNPNAAKSIEAGINKTITSKIVPHAPRDGAPSEIEEWTGGGGWQYQILDGSRLLARNPDTGKLIEVKPEGANAEAYQAIMAERSQMRGGEAPAKPAAPAKAEAPAKPAAKPPGRSMYHDMLAGMDMSPMRPGNGMYDVSALGGGYEEDLGPNPPQAAKQPPASGDLEALWAWAMSQPEKLAELQARANAATAAQRGER